MHGEEREGGREGGGKGEEGGSEPVEKKRREYEHTAHYCQCILQPINSFYYYYFACFCGIIVIIIII